MYLGQILISVKIPVNHLPRPVELSLILFLRWFTAYAYYVNDCVISLFTLPRLIILLRIIDFRFNAFSPDKVVFTLLLKQIHILS